MWNSWSLLRADGLGRRRASRGYARESDVDCKGPDSGSRAADALCGRIKA